MDYPKRYSLRFFYMITYLKLEKIVKKPQKLGSVTIFSYICSRIHRRNIIWDY